jgi:hypothetical protein
MAEAVAVLTAAEKATFGEDADNAINTLLRDQSLENVYNDCMNWYQALPTQDADPSAVTKKSLYDANQ